MIKTLVFLSIIFFNVLAQDCSTVKCALPSCPEGFKSVTKPGSCCQTCEKTEPLCPLGCSTFFNGCNICSCSSGKFLSCTKKKCFVAGTPKCLKQDCSRVKCAISLCAKGFKLVTKPGSCCQTCEKSELDCSLVRCAQVLECPKGSELVKKGCCSTCVKPVQEICTSGCTTLENPVKPNCSLVRCALPKCTLGFKPVTKPGSCCATCEKIVQDCSLVKCAQVLECPAGSELVKKGCCATCVKPVQSDCSLVPCALPKCALGFKPVTKLGSCCPKCEKTELDCSLVRCALPKCALGFKPVTKLGSCCQTCEKTEAPCPLGCGTFFDGCNTCKCSSGQKLLCTKKYCFAAGTSKCLQPDCSLVKCAQVLECPKGLELVKEGCCASCVKPFQEKCPSGCSIFFDGCNNCKCLNGKTIGCTRRACLVAGEPKCLKAECSAVLCALGNCETGFVSVQKKGECCSTCVSLDTDTETEN